MATERIYPGQFGPVAPVYVWQYPLRLVHWGIVISIGVLSVTGYYIHDPYIIGQTQHPFLMGWFRFVHEVFGMIFLVLFLLRVYLFFGGNKWEGWRQFIPLSKDRFREMWEVTKFYCFMRPTAVSKIGHNQMAALSYVGIYGLILVEIVTGLVMYQRLLDNAFLRVLVGWIPRIDQSAKPAADSLLLDVRVCRIWDSSRVSELAGLASGDARPHGQHLYRL